MSVKSGQPITDNQRCNVVTSFECRFLIVTADIGHSISYLYRFQCRTSIEGISLNAFHFIGDCDFCQAAAVRKSLFSDVFQAVIQNYAVQFTTIIECRRTDGTGTVGEVYCSKAGTSIESVIADRS